MYPNIMYPPQNVSAQNISDNYTYPEQNVSDHNIYSLQKKSNHKRFPTTKGIQPEKVSDEKMYPEIIFLSLNLKFSTKKTQYLLTKIISYS